MHEIRLAGPWERTDGNAVTRVALPHAISSDQGLVRRFHCPTGISDDTRLFIVVRLTGEARNLTGTCNGKPVSVQFAQNDVLMEITPHINHHNELNLHATNENPIEVESVRLRISEPN